MEFFPDGGFVRLQSRQNRKYIHADGDWVGVTLRPLGRVPSLEAVWRVEHWVSHRGRVFVLLQNAAYGRYLSLSVHPARPRRLSRRVIQRDFDDPNLVDAFLWRWRAQRVDPDQDYVRLRQFNFHLRADGRYLTWNWKTRVTGDLVRRRTLTTMMQWTVHAVAATPLPLPLPVTPPEPQVRGFAILPPILLPCIALEWDSPRSDSFPWNANHRPIIVIDASILIFACLAFILA
jgi:hypothetical protein